MLFALYYVFYLTPKCADCVAVSGEELLTPHFI